MTGSVNICIRVDEDVKKQCEDLYREIGVTLSSAINVFLRQSVREGGFPFELKVDRMGSETSEPPKKGSSDNKYSVGSDGRWGSL